MKTRILHTKFWKDSFVAELTPVEKLIFNYLLTNEKVTILHLYECTDREIMFDTGATKDQVTRAKQKLQEAGKVFFYKDYVLLGNADRYETYTGERNDTAREKLLKELSSDVLAWYTNPLDRGIEGVYIPSINQKSEIINHNLEDTSNIKKRIPEANIQAALYAGLREKEIPCILELKYYNCRFDCAILRNGKIIAIVEVKSYANDRPANTDTKQFSKYSQFDIPVLYLVRMEDLEITIEEIMDIYHGGTHEGLVIPESNAKRKTVDAITQNDITEISTDYEVPIGFVLSKMDDLKNYCGSTGKTYKDYKLTLRNWVKKDAVKLVMDSRKGVKSVDAEKILRGNSGQGRSFTEPGGVRAIEAVLPTGNQSGVVQEQDALDPTHYQN